MSTSDQVFPMSLPGIGLRLSRELTTTVLVQESIGGRESRSTWRTVPQTRYRLSIDFLRSTAALDELRQALRFFAARHGMLDSFLLDDPEDNTVLDKLESTGTHGFGVGDNTTAIFQVQRSLKAAAYDKAGGPWAFSTVGRVNCAPRSRQFEVSPWVKTNLGAGTVCFAPDGSYSAYRYTSSGTATLAATSFSRLAGVARTFSIFARSTAGGTLRIGTTEATSASFTLSEAWQRIYVTYTSAGGTNTLTIGASSSWGTGRTIELFQAQDEETPTPASLLYTAPDAITGSSSTTSAPSYWPNPGDGFEPVYDFKTATPPKLYKGALEQTYATDFSWSGYGQVTFVAAPAAGEAVSWVGSYYKRVRFAQPGLSVERMVQGMWRAGGVELVSVIP